MLSGIIKLIYFGVYHFDMVFQIVLRDRSHYWVLDKYLTEWIRSYDVYLNIFFLSVLLKDKYPNFEVGLKCIIMVF